MFKFVPELEAQTVRLLFMRLRDASAELFKIQRTVLCIQELVYSVAVTK